MTIERSEDPAALLVPHGDDGFARIGAGVLLSLVAEGDILAFAELYDRTAAEVMRIIEPDVPDTDQVNAATIATYLEVWTTASRFAASGDDPLAWIAAVAEHQRRVSMSITKR
jgi:RNA polymerase sigma-70 factor (ECF subfamily)